MSIAIESSKRVRLVQAALHKAETQDLLPTTPFQDTDDLGGSLMPSRLCRTNPHWIKRVSAISLVLDGTRSKALSFAWAFARADFPVLARQIMPRSPFSKPLLATLATLFAAATILYSGLWMYGTATHWQSGVELGFDNEYVASEHCELIRSVMSGSPAERAGLRPGDRILRIDGRQIQNAYSLGDVWNRHRPGDTVELAIERANVSAPFVVKAVFRPAGHLGWMEGGITQHLGEDIMDMFPVVFLVVGLAVLFLRLEDPNAWLLALMFAGFIAIPSFPDWFAGLGPSLRPFAMAYRAIFDSSIGALFYFFFAVFPARSPLDRRASWLKWVGLATGVSLALANLRVGDPRAPAGTDQAGGGTCRQHYSIVLPLWVCRVGLGLAYLECLQHHRPRGAPQDSSNSLGDAGGRRTGPGATRSS